jgi:hypothetical protein
MDKELSVKHLKDASGKISMQLREKLVAIQAGRMDAPAGWIYPVRDLSF